MVVPIAANPELPRGSPQWSLNHSYIIHYLHWTVNHLSMILMRIVSPTSMDTPSKPPVGWSHVVIDGKSLSLEEGECILKLPLINHIPGLTLQCRWITPILPSKGSKSIVTS